MWIFDSVTMLKEATYPQLCGNMVAKHLLICLSKRFKHHHRPPTHAPPNMKRTQLIRFVVFYEKNDLSCMILHFD